MSWSDPLDAAALTRDEPAPGLFVHQPRRGYRYGVEVYALADFALASDERATSAVDLGCGSGVVGLLMAWARPSLRVRAFDREARWVALAARSAVESGLDVQVAAVDIRDLTARDAQADVAVANPPWFVAAAGPLATDSLRAASRAMLHGGPREFVEAGLRVAPRVCVVTRPARLRDLAELRDARIARRAFLGDAVALVEVSRAPGPVAPVDCLRQAADPEVDVSRAYARFGR